MGVLSMWKCPQNLEVQEKVAEKGTENKDTVKEGTVNPSNEGEWKTKEDVEVRKDLVFIS